jgi:hypothetical protein
MNDNGFDMDTGEVIGWKKFVKVAVFLVYVAGALFATIMFSQSLASLFPDNPWLRTAAYAGSWANFASVVVMLLAKDYWISGRAMRGVAWFFWAAEVAVLVLNVLAVYHSSWADWWTPLAPAAPVLVVAIWGILWNLSPDHKRRESITDFYASSQEDFQNKLRRAMKSQQVQEIMSGAAQEAARQYAEKSLNVVLDGTHKSGNASKPKESASTVASNNGKAFASDTVDMPAVNPTRRRKSKD